MPHCPICSPEQSQTPFPSSLLLVSAVEAPIFIPVCFCTSSPSVPLFSSLCTLFSSPSPNPHLSSSHHAYVQNRATLTPGSSTLLHLPSLTLAGFPLKSFIGTEVPAPGNKISSPAKTLYPKTAATPRWLLGHQKAINHLPPSDHARSNGFELSS